MESADLHADEAVLDNVDAAHAVLASDLVQVQVHVHNPVLGHARGLVRHLAGALEGVCVCVCVCV